jgi:gag-polypeptide of LTR copia-type
MWSSLEAIFKSKAHLTLCAYKRNLESLKANEDMDIIKHLDELKIYWERINSSLNKDHHISDFSFKLTIGDLLPSSWDNFTDPYINITDDPITECTNHRKLVSSQQFMGIIKEEYLHHVCHKAETQDSNHHTIFYIMSSNSNSSKAKCCKQCGRSNNIT